MTRGAVILIILSAAAASWAILAGVFWVVVSAADGAASYFARVPF